MTLSVPAVANIDFQSLQDFPWNLNPSSPLVKAPDGYFYGLTIEGGNHNGGTIYRIAPGSDLQLVHHFARIEGGIEPNDGGTHPENALVLAQDGCLYGATRDGGAYGRGVIFKYDPAGGVFSVVHHFGPGWYDDGMSCAGLFQDAAGDLIGFTRDGGTLGGGVIFRLTPAGEYSILHSFEQPPLYTPSTLPARFPLSSPTNVFQGSDGRLYGSASAGGATNQDWMFPGKTYGAAFRLEATGEITILHEFTAAEGGSGKFVEGVDGALYGTTGQVSFMHRGTFYRITKDGQYTTLHSLSWEQDDEGIIKIFRASDGHFYGYDYNGGSFRGGAIKRYTNTGELSTVHNFPLAYRGVQRSGLLEVDGFLYGTMNRAETRVLRDVIDERVPTNGFVLRYATSTVERSLVEADKSTTTLERRNGAAYRLKIDPLALENTAPIARSEVRVVKRKLRKLTVPVLANDRDPDGDAIQVDGVVSTEEVAASVDSTGNRLQLTILTPLTHTQSIAYSVSDGTGGVSQASVVLRPRLSGRYRGTLKVADVTGTANLVVGSRGTFSGVFKIGNRRYRARGGI